MAIDADALNYPYIRIRRADWLKRTLLIFPHVVRMTPFRDAPADDPEISRFCQLPGPRTALLRSADLWSDHVRRAQMQLISQLDHLLEERGDELIARFSRRNAARIDRGQTSRKRTVWELRLSPNPSFQIHRHKMFPELADFLLQRNLAWRPESFNAHGPDYLEMNPRLGEAIMATLATACAENEGLQVVTEFPKLHGSLIGVSRDAILETCIDEREQSGRTSGRQIAEFLVYRRCNVENLTAENLVALKSERDLLARFRTRVEELASTLPPEIHSKERLEERLNDMMTTIFNEWRSDEVNLSGYVRKLFGGDAIKEPGKLIQKLVESAANRDAFTATATVGGVTGTAAAHFGGLTLGITAGAAAGFAAAVVFHGIGALAETVKSSRNSPFRYLTTLQKHGVAFSMAHEPSMGSVIGRTPRFS